MNNEYLLCLKIKRLKIDVRVFKINMKKIGNFPKDRAYIMLKELIK